MTKHLIWFAAVRRLQTNERFDIVDFYLTEPENIKLKRRKTKQKKKTVNFVVEALRLNSIRIKCSLWTDVVVQLTSVSDWEERLNESHNVVVSMIERGMKNTQFRIPETQK